MPGIELNPGLQGEKQECCLCAMGTPQGFIFIIPSILTKISLSFCPEIEIVEASLAKFRKYMEHEKQNGRAEIEERALVLRETTRHKDRVAKLLEECIVFQSGKKRCDTDKVWPDLDIDNCLWI